MTKFETPRLILREWNLADAQFLFELNNDPDVVKYTGDSAFDSLSHAQEFIKGYDHYKLQGHGRWLCIDKTSAEPLGWCGLKKTSEADDLFIDLGFRFKKQHWGKGFATESAYASLNYGFKKLGFTEIVARSVKENHASIGVMRKLGFTFWKGAACHGLPAEYYRLRREEFEEYVRTNGTLYPVSFE